MPKNPDDDKNTCRNVQFGQRYGTAVGELDVHRPRTCEGKKVMTWDFQPLGTDKNYQIEVVYLLDGDGRMYFKATNPQLGLKLANSDIEALRRETELRLMLVSADIQAMKWEDWLEVSVSGSGSSFNANSYTGMGAELKIHIQRLKRGWHEPTQRHVTVGQDGLLKPFPNPTEFSTKEKPRTNDGDGAKGGLRLDDLDWLTGGAKPQTAYIPDTPENMAALKDIQARLGALQDRLMALLHQDVIHESLSGLDTLLLPSAVSTKNTGDQNG